MTPFDDRALLAMLLAFYPIASPAALRQARAERPEYFAGGALIGHSGDKLQLPDRRIWDLIFAVDDPRQRHWQAIYADPNAPAVDDPFALEEGPLTTIDEETFLPPRLEGPTLVELAGAELEALGGSDDVLHQAATRMAEFDGERGLTDAYEAHVTPAREQHAALRRALDAHDPTDVLEQSAAHGTTIDTSSAGFEEEAPDDIAEYDPGPSPRDDTTEPPPPAQA